MNFKLLLYSWDLRLLLYFGYYGFSRAQLLQQTYTPFWCICNWDKPICGSLILAPSKAHKLLLVYKVSHAFQNVFTAVRTSNYSLLKTRVEFIKCAYHTLYLNYLCTLLELYWKYSHCKVSLLHLTCILLYHLPLHLRQKWTKIKEMAARYTTEAFSTTPVQYI